MTQQMYNPMKPALNREAIAGRGGFTLVELLVASAGGLILMGFVAVVFSFYGRTVSENQAIIRMHDSMRSAAWKLRQDLEGITCDVKPWIRPEQDAGYFELIEGPLTDADATDVDFDPNDGIDDRKNLVADVDDVLMFTTLGNGSGFIGKHASSTMAADAAEVAWFCVQQPGPPVDGMNLYSLHRRQLLVVGYVGTNDFMSNKNTLGDGIQVNMPAVFQDYDISLRYAAGPILFPNSLSDLTKRENRFLHRYDSTLNSTYPYHFTIDQAAVTSAFPYDLNLVRLRGNPASVSNPPWPWNSDAVLTGDREGEDVVIRNVLAFDVRVFDPAASPPDYIDLGGIAGTTLGNAGGLSPPTYCTWSYHYEFNGLDEDGDVDIDEGTDLVDNNTNGAVDEVAEYETAPPYNVPLRGIEIRLRCYEPQGKQIRQVTIRHAF